MHKKIEWNRVALWLSLIQDRCLEEPNFAVKNTTSNEHLQHLCTLAVNEQFLQEYAATNPQGIECVFVQLQLNHG